jgi:hypothetical protein
MKIRQWVMNGLVRYFTRWFWAYMLEKPVTLRKLICRYRGHKAGMIWNNAGGLSPNTKCRNCGDDIG